MFIVEEETKPNKWKEHPLQFKDIEAAERYALSLYKEKRNARVVDERYRKGRKDVAES
jgi:hypothetical protein